ncbi:MAG: hypothetical protein KAQ62_08265 [Cyclobacteriaceae bacterium]|nr:hypothetical protein [Cyclobacteriaceae bacterium]
MKKDELIDKILSDLYMNSNRAMDFFDDFCVYENDINKLEEVKTDMEKEGLIKNHKNHKISISPLGFKICFDGGFLNDKVKKERQINHMFQRNKREIAFLKKRIRSKNRVNTFLVILLISSLMLLILIALGIVDLSFGI